VVGDKHTERVMLAPSDGAFEAVKAIGDLVKQGETLAKVNGEVITAPFDGVLRGLINPAVEIRKGMKVGDLDPRNDPQLCDHISDKALAIGGGVLEAILSKAELRPHLWT
jgi:xanthine dehydrogenase accessory factor